MAVVLTARTDDGVEISVSQLGGAVMEVSGKCDNVALISPNVGA